MRTPACRYPPLTPDEIYGKVLARQAVMVDGDPLRSSVRARRSDRARSHEIGRGL
jgi:hypothetical protein